MRFLIVLLFSFFSLPSFCQNWEIVPIDKKLHFQTIEVNTGINDNLTDKTELRTVWVDSIVTIANKQYHYLNLLGKRQFDLTIDSSFVFGKKFILTNNEITFGIENQYKLNKTKTVGESWIFDSQNNISASLISVVVDSIFSVTDSIKTLALSTGQKIKWSKSNGLISLGLSSNKKLKLAGIQYEGGAQIPDFEEMFTLQVGDTLIYLGEYCYREDINWFCNESISKIWIESANYSTSGVTYTGKEQIITAGSQPNWILPYSAYYSSGGITSSFNNQIDNFGNSTFLELNYYSHYYAFNGRYTKEVTGVFCDFTGAGNFEYCLGDMTIAYTEGLGLTKIVGGNSEEWKDVNLIGYKLGGGLVQVDNINQNQSSAIVFPNPSSGLVNYSITVEENHEEFDIIVYNSTGKKVKKTIHSNRAGQIDLSGFENGIYLVTFWVNGNKIGMEKIMINR